MAQFEHYRQQLEQTAEPVIVKQADNLDSELQGLPEKLRGKSAQDIARMYLDLEVAHSRQGNELGELRRTVVEPKEVVKEETKVQRPEITADELLAKPNESLDKAIETHPSVQQAREMAIRAERAQAQAQFSTEYPEYTKDLNSQDFVDWVKKNPARVDLIMKANNYDLSAARSLWGMWSEHRELVTTATTKANADAERRQAEKDATLEGGTGADIDTETVYSRAEWTDLQRRALLGDKKAKTKWEDPKFRELRQKAYAEGRVK